MLEVVGDTLEPGAVIAKAYRLRHVLGEGGMGVVWEAEEVATGRRVALKFLREGEGADPKTRERFVREARAAMAVAHPNIARVEAIIETESGAPFMVMELLEGEPMRSFLRRRGTLSAFETAELLLPVVDAVNAAHTARIVHRDLKPENVFLVNGREVRVLDFGIAKRLPRHDETNTASASLTSTGAFLGTPFYMAPEQIFGDQDIDGRADVWALGVILYECLAGRRPTEADGFGQIIKRITTEPLVPLEQARKGLPKPLTKLVMRMLSKDRAARPSLDEARGVLLAIINAGDSATIDDEAPPGTLRLPPSDHGPSPSATTRALPPISPRQTPAQPPAASHSQVAPPPRTIVREKTKLFPILVAIAVTICGTTAFLELGASFVEAMRRPYPAKPKVSITPIKVNLNLDGGTGISASDAR